MNHCSFTSSFDFGDSANWGDHFKRDLTAILKSRDSSKAMDFFNDYGTHYIKEAVMGGRKESVFIVDYCSLEETSTFKIDFEANLLLMYKGIHNISMDAVYKNTMDEKEKKVVKSGPTTTCIGGNTLNRKVRNFVLSNFYMCNLQQNLCRTVFLPSTDVCAVALSQSQRDKRAVNTV